MKIAVLRERHPGELRVAATADTVRKLAGLGVSTAIEAGAGSGSGISDSAFVEAGATLKNTIKDTVAGASALLCVNPPSEEVLTSLSPGALVIGTFSLHENKRLIQTCAERKLSAFAMELMPRISRAQGMDVLSSQSNLAGYRAVIDGVAALGKAVPMMMTAAGTVAPAKVLILGAGVAGLQAIATAKRLGAVVSAFDVRPAVKEQVESLGAKFIAVGESRQAETSGGYAQEMDEEYQRRQSALIHETIVKQDLVITTALIPGKPAPVLITEAMVKEMKSGSVIVDLAVNAGGNCPLSRADEVTRFGGVTILAYSNVPSRIAQDASPLYARNLLNFVTTLISKEGRFAPNLEDELVKGTLLTHDGAILQARFA